MGTLNFSWSEGLRIVDIGELAKQMYCKYCKVLLDLNRTEREARFGLASVFFVVCNGCGSTNEICSGKGQTSISEGRTLFDINVKASSSVLFHKAGGKYVVSFLSKLDIPLPTPADTALPGIQFASENSSQGNNLFETDGTSSSSYVFPSTFPETETKRFSLAPRNLKIESDDDTGIDAKFTSVKDDDQTSSTKTGSKRCPRKRASDTASSANAKTVAKRGRKTEPSVSSAASSSSKPSLASYSSDRKESKPRRKNTPKKNPRKSVYDAEAAELDKIHCIQADTDGSNETKANSDDTGIADNKTGDSSDDGTGSPDHNLLEETEKLEPKVSYRCRVCSALIASHKGLRIHLARKHKLVNEITGNECEVRLGDSAGATVRDKSKATCIVTTTPDPLRFASSSLVDASPPTSTHQVSSSEAGEAYTSDQFSLSQAIFPGMDLLAPVFSTGVQDAAQNALSSVAVSNPRLARECSSTDYPCVLRTAGSSELVKYPGLYVGEETDNNHQLEGELLHEGSLEGHPKDAPPKRLHAASLIQSSNLNLPEDCQQSPSSSILDAGTTGSEASTRRSSRCRKPSIQRQAPADHGFFCSESTCGRKFASEDKYQTHLRKHHQLTGLHQCLICSKEFPSKKYLKGHITTQHSSQESREMQCSWCELRLPNKDKLRKHIKREHPKGSKHTFHCKECPATFDYRCKLKMHMLKHTGERPYQCFKCEVRFRTSSCRSSHMQTIHGEGRKFLCDTCGTGFHRQHELTSHRRIHTGDKPFQCHVCAERFTKKEYLKIHIRTHTGERPYICPVCGKGFSQRGSLSIHRRKIHGMPKQVRVGSCYKN